MGKRKFYLSQIYLCFGATGWGIWKKEYLNICQESLKGNLADCVDLESRIEKNFWSTHKLVIHMPLEDRFKWTKGRNFVSQPF